MIIPSNVTEIYFKLKNRKQIKIYIPQLLQTDYDAGVLERYFAQHKITKKIYEINKEYYQAMISKNIEYPFELYTIIKILWKLTGVKNDIKINNKIYYGVEDTNKRSVERAEFFTPGIKRKLKNLTEFARIDKNYVQ